MYCILIYLFNYVTYVTYVADLDAYSSHLLRLGHAPSTRRTYAAAVSKYLYMCTTLSINPLPVDDIATRRFITYLTMQRVNPRTISVYLAGLRAWYVTTGAEPPHMYTASNQLLLRSVEKLAPPPRRTTPITVSNLEALLKVLNFDQNNLMYISAMLIIFYGCMRASELCVHPVSNPTPARMAQFRVLKEPLLLQYRATSSKTATNGFLVNIGCTGTQCCPVCVFIMYVRLRAPLALYDSVFVLSSGQPLSYTMLNGYMKKVLPLIGLGPKCYSPHSLRAGAATAAADAGCSAHQIQRLGRWASQAYVDYIRPSPAADAAMAAIIHNTN